MTWSARRIVGVDVGGANLKLTSVDGRSVAIAFPMWLKHRELGATMAGLLDQHFPHFDQLAVTMTGELADCFHTRREGVAVILNQLEHAVAPKQLHIYAVGNRWLTVPEAISDPWSVAASNWYALGTWLAHWLPTEHAVYPQLIVDIGSTTVDIIPLKLTQQCGPDTPARTDRDRLTLAQLVYSGMQRTPVAAILKTLKVNNQLCSVMAERFATSDDAYLSLNLVEEDPRDCDTADGRSRTCFHARARLARMVGEDIETLSVEAINSIADQIIDAQSWEIAGAVMKNLDANNSDFETAPLVFCGHGRPLAERILGFLPPLPAYHLEDFCSAEVSRCAPAFAVAWLLQHHFESATKDVESH